MEGCIRFEDMKFDVVLSSPLSRALDTARVFTDQTIIEHEGLKEMNFGIFEGMTYDEISEKYPEEVIKWKNTTRDYQFKDGECLKDFYEKVVNITVNA